MFNRLICALIICHISFRYVAGDGTVRTRIPGRIVGGYETTIEKHPYQALLEYKGRPLCGGSIISSRAILTAAHCLHERNLTNFVVRVGSDLSGQGTPVRVLRYIQHENFKIETHDYDVAVIILDNDLKFTKTIRDIAVPEETYEIVADSSITLVGWGSQGCGSSIARKLRAVSVPVVDFQICHERYAKFRSITPRMFCGGLLDVGGRDSCQGDSGGPVVQNDKVVGVISWGADCGSKHFPGVYTNVPSVRQWIVDKISSLK